MKKTAIIIIAIAAVLLMISMTTAVTATSNQANILSNNLLIIKEKLNGINDDPNDPQPTCILVSIVGFIITIISLIIIWLLSPGYPPF